MRASISSQWQYPSHDDGSPLQDASHLAIELTCFFMSPAWLEVILSRHSFLHLRQFVCGAERHSAHNRASTHIPEP